MENVSSGFETAINQPGRQISSYIAIDNGITNNPTFTRNSIAYTSDGEQVAANTPRFEPGKFGKAVMVEEGTTNLVSNPLAKDNLAGIATGFFGGSAGTVERSTALPSGCPWATGVKTTVTVAGDANLIFKQTDGVKDTTGIPVTAGATYTYSIWLYIPSNSSITRLALRPIEWNSSGGVVRDNYLTVFTTKGVWQRVTATWTLQSTTAKVTLRVCTTGTGEFYATACMLEQKPYATTFTDGTRAAENCTIPGTVLNPQEGTIEFRVYVDPNIHNATSNWNMAFSVSDTNEYNEIRFGHQAYSTLWHADFSNDIGTHWHPTFALSPGWRYIALTWNKTTTTAKVYVDGMVVVSNATAPLPSAFAATAYIGSWINSVFQLNTLIDDLRISNIARSDAEIAEAYASGQLLPTDEHTTYKLNFDDNINNSLVYNDSYIIDLTLDNTVNPDDSFMLGANSSDKLEVTVVNMPNDIILETSTITPYIGVLVGNRQEYVPLGVFNVDKVTKTKLSTKLTCFDNMIKLEYPYVSSLSYPAPISAVVNEICEKANITLATPIPNTLINEISGYTMREAISFIASFLGGFAHFNRDGALEIRSYTDTAVTILPEQQAKFKRGEKVFTIGRLVCSVGEDGEGNPIILQAGDSGDLVQFQNPIMTQAQLDNIYAQLSQLSFMPYEMTWRGNPALTAGDKIAIVDAENNTYHTLLMEQQIQYTGGLRATAAAKAATQNEQEFQSAGSLTQQVNRYTAEQAVIKTLLADKASINDLQAVNAKIDNLVVDEARIADASITTAKIRDAAITTAKIADAAVGTAKIQAGAITTALIETGAVGTAQIADGSITDAKIVSLTANKISAGTIDTGQVTVQGANGKLKIANNRLQVFDSQTTPVERVTLGDINNDGTIYGLRVRGADGVTVLYDQNGVYTEGITDGAITNPKIGTDAVDSRVIAANAVTADTIVAGAVTTDKLAAGAVTANKIAAGTITAGSAIIADGAITTAKIGDAQITNAKIANASIDAAKIVDGSITNAEIANATITGAKIALATIDTANIKDAAITNAKISSLDASKITTGTLSADRIAANSITGNKIAAGAITADKIAAGAITADKIYAQTLSGITLTGVTLRSTGDTWIGQDIYLYGDNQGYAGGSIYFGITDPPALAPLIYGYEDGTRNNLDFYVTNGTITFETMQFNLNCNIHTTGDVYCYNLYATSRVKANTVISGTVQTDRLQGKTSSEVIYIGTGTCRFDVAGGTLRIQSSSNNYMALTSTGRFIIYVGGVAKHVFMEDGTKRGGTIVIDDVNYGMSPIDSPEILISDLIRDVKLTKGINTIEIDDLTAKAIDGYSVFFEKPNITVQQKNKNNFTVYADSDIITDVMIVGNRLEYKNYRWKEVEAWT